MGSRNLSNFLFKKVAYICIWLYMSLKKIDSFISRVVFRTIWPKKWIIWVIMRLIFQKSYSNASKTVTTRRIIIVDMLIVELGFCISTLVPLCWFEIVTNTHYSIVTFKFLTSENSSWEIQISNLDIHILNLSTTVFRDQEFEGCKK